MASSSSAILMTESTVGPRSWSFATLSFGSAVDAASFRTKKDTTFAVQRDIVLSKQMEYLPV